MRAGTLPRPGVIHGCSANSPGGLRGRRTACSVLAPIATSTRTALAASNYGGGMNDGTNACSAGWNACPGRSDGQFAGQAVTGARLCKRLRQPGEKGPMRRSSRPQRGTDIATGSRPQNPDLNRDMAPRVVCGTVVVPVKPDSDPKMIVTRKDNGAPQPVPIRKIAPTICNE